MGGHEPVIEWPAWLQEQMAVAWAHVHSADTASLFTGTLTPTEETKALLAQRLRECQAQGFVHVPLEWSP